MITPAPSQEKSIIAPDAIEALSVFKQDIFATLNCVKVGKIVTFDGTKQTAEIKLLFKRTLPDGSVQPYPLLVDCPVFTPQGGGGFIQFPIKAGDNCLVLFSDRNLDAWYSAGDEAAPLDGRCHDLSDGICLVGLNSLASSLPAAAADAVTLSYAGAVVTLKADVVTITAGGSTLTFTGGNWTVSDSGGAQLGTAGALVKLSNGSTTLLTLLNGLIDVLTAALVQGPSNYPLTAATIAALNAYKVTLAGLLQ
jgi:hypothetical protein